MGYESFTSPGATPAANPTEPWIQYRSEFPVTKNLVYLNHAGVSPLCRRAAEAMKNLADDALLYGSYHYSQWLDAYEGLRVAAARLINTDKREIAIVKNTSEGIATIAMGLNWKPGDKIVAFREEFPANYFPWLRLQSKGVRVEWLSITDPLERIEEATRGARLLAVSFVQYLGGYRADLKAIGDICHRQGVFFFVDAIQGLGAFPLDARSCRIHALAADGHKWMMGPEGCGILYVRADVQESIEPVEFGWTNIAGYNDFACRDMALRADAGRYECGTLNTIGVYGLRAALEFILEVGVERIAPAVQSLADRVAAAAKQRGYTLLQERTPETGAGIVSFRREDIDSRMVVKRLAEAGFMAAPRQGWVRVSPHFYIDPAEMDRLAESLP
ncbi:MAG TPA: aminotransferase class V-fold PLP-dependent enzyme [Bryobacteraceae bacterium]|nr:aminotransferase class V-fold PLP-dependent enzyme [Bryobacteraceae bacterium]